MKNTLRTLSSNWSRRASAPLHLAGALALLSPLTGCASDAGGHGGDAGVERGPIAMEVDGDPNGLWWDDAEQALYIADDDGNRVLRWTDTEGFSKVLDLPEAPESGAGLGQLVRTADGTLVVTRFGGGSAGAVAYAPLDGAPALVPGLDVERRRIGLTVAPDGRLFDSWFVRLESGERLGAVGALDLAGAEPEVITGLKKPVGVLVVGDALFVSDQDLGQILKAPLADPASYTVLATVASPDLLAAGPDGSLFTGSEGGSLFRIAADGRASVFQSGFDTIRGVAYDPTNRRVFVVNHVGHEAQGVTHRLHILPVD
jgi:sugar lactone lactonase YvrE